MTIEELKKDIDNCVENHLLDSMVFYAQEYTNIMPQRHILEEFFWAVAKLCHNVDKSLKEDCD